MVNDMKSRTITRRTALKTAVGSLIGIGSTTGLVSSASGEKMVKFPSLVSGTEVDKWLKVPKVWYEHQRHASNVHTRLKSRIQNTPGIKQTQLVRSPKKYGGVNGLKIEVIGNSNSDFQYNLPSEVEGVPISGTSLESQPELACIDDSNHCTNYETDDWLRPGEYVDGGTAGSRVIMPSGEKRMLTAAHLFHDGDACNIADHDLVGRNANVVTSQPAPLTGRWLVLTPGQTGV